MTKITDLLERIFTLTSKVDRLIDDVKDLQTDLKLLNDTVVRSEERLNSYVEKAEAAAIKAASTVTAEIITKVHGGLASDLKDLSQKVLDFEATGTNPKLPKD